MDKILETYYQQIKVAIEKVDMEEYESGLNELNTYLATATYQKEDVETLTHYSKKIKELIVQMEKEHQEQLQFLIAQQGKLKTAQKYSQF